MPERFKNDLFISYRRASNGNPDHWVDAFCGALRNNLAEMLGRDVRIWRDTQIAAGDIWRQELRDAVDGSAVFLAVFSAGYFYSDECRKEFDRFLQRMKNDDGASLKLFPVFKQPLNPDPPAPKELGSLQSHEFFHWSPPGTGRYVELGPENTGAGERNFWTSLSWLAQDIQKSLDTLDKDVEATALGKVFVSCVCPELEWQRKQLRADLQQAGYIVLPRHEYIWSEADNADRIAADLDAALLSVHLVTGQRSNDPDSAGRSRLQLAIAQRLAQASGGAMHGGDRKPPPLAWIQPSASIDASAAPLIDAIRGEFANAGVEYLSGSFEALKTEVYATLGEFAARRGPPGGAALADAAPAADAPAAPARPDVALIVEAGEIAATGPLMTLFADRLGTGVRQIKFDGASAQNAERMRKVLAACPRCLVFWSGQTEDWLDDVLDHPELAAYLGRATLAVHLDGPKTPEKAVFRSPKATVLDAGAADFEVALRAFLGA